MTTPLYNDEMQLAGWSDTHTGGAKVTFWLPNPEALEPFRAMTIRKGNTAGQRLAVCIVEIGEDGQPQQQEPKAEAPVVERPPGGPLAKLAGQWCADKAFQHWVAFNHGGLIERLAMVSATQGENMSSEQIAAEVVRHYCRINSRSELDWNPAAAKRFDEGFRFPYQKHLIARNSR